MATVSESTRPRAEDETPSLDVVRALAVAEGVAPESLDVCLADAVDLEALDDLVASAECEVRFRVDGYEVTVGTLAGDDVDVRVAPA